MQYQYPVMKIVNRINVLNLKSLGKLEALNVDGKVAFPLSMDENIHDVVNLQRELQVMGILKEDKALTGFTDSRNEDYVYIAPNAIDENALFAIDVTDQAKSWTKTSKKSTPQLEISDIARYIDTLAPVPNKDKNDPQYEGNPGACLALIAQIVGVQNPAEINAEVKDLVYRHRSDEHMQKEFSKMQKALVNSKNQSGPSLL